MDTAKLPKKYPGPKLFSKLATYKNIQGMTIDELCKRLGWHYQQYYSLNNARRTVRRETLAHNGIAIKDHWETDNHGNRHFIEKGGKTLTQQEKEKRLAEEDKNKSIRQLYAEGLQEKDNIKGSKKINLAQDKMLEGTGRHYETGSNGTRYMVKDGNNAKLDETHKQWISDYVKDLTKEVLDRGDKLSTYSDNIVGRAVAKAIRAGNISSDLSFQAEEYARELMREERRKENYKRYVEPKENSGLKDSKGYDLSSEESWLGSMPEHMQNYYKKHPDVLKEDYKTQLQLAKNERNAKEDKDMKKASRRGSY